MAKYYLLAVFLLLRNMRNIFLLGKVMISLVYYRILQQNVGRYCKEYIILLTREYSSCNSRLLECTEFFLKIHRNKVAKSASSNDQNMSFNISNLNKMMYYQKYKSMNALHFGNFLTYNC